MSASGLITRHLIACCIIGILSDVRADAQENRDNQVPAVAVREQASTDYARILSELGDLTDRSNEYRANTKKTLLRLESEKQDISRETSRINHEITELESQQTKEIKAFDRVFAKIEDPAISLRISELRNRINQSRALVSDIDRYVSMAQRQLSGIDNILARIEDVRADVNADKENVEVSSEITSKIIDLSIALDRLVDLDRSASRVDFTRYLDRKARLSEDGTAIRKIWDPSKIWGLE